MLDRISWDFKEYKRSGVYNIHGALGSFIPQIPNILISYLTEEGSIICDPFAGSGTTAIEAAKLNRKAKVVDFSPLFVKIMKAKLTFHDLDKLNRTYTSLRSSINNSQRTLIPDFPNRNKWYNDKTLRELGTIYYNIENIDEEEYKNYFEVIFSSILKKCSTQKDHYTYVADNMPGKTAEYKDAISFFLNNAKDSISTLDTFYKEISNNGLNPESVLNNIQIERGDARDLNSIKSNSIDLVLTSPPYVNVHDYIKGYRLSYYWLSQSSEFGELKFDEIGARFKRGRNNAIEDYLDEMALVFKEMKRILKSGGDLSLIIGETSSVRKKVIVRDELMNILNELGFTLLKDKMYRRISHRRVRRKYGVDIEEIIILLKE